MDPKSSKQELTQNLKDQEDINYTKKNFNLKTVQKTNTKWDEIFDCINVYSTSIFYDMESIKKNSKKSFKNNIRCTKLY